MFAIRARTVYACHQAQQDRETVLLSLTQRRPYIDPSGPHTMATSSPLAYLRTQATTPSLHQGDRDSSETKSQRRKDHLRARPINTKYSALLTLIIAPVVSNSLATSGIALSTVVDEMGERKPHQLKEKVITHLRRGEKREYTSSPSSWYRLLVVDFLDRVRRGLRLLSALVMVSGPLGSAMSTPDTWLGIGSRCRLVRCEGGCVPLGWLMDDVHEDEVDVLLLFVWSSWPSCSW